MAIPPPPPLPPLTITKNNFQHFYSSSEDDDLPLSKLRETNRKKTAATAAAAVAAAQETKETTAVATTAAAAANGKLSINKAKEEIRSTNDGWELSGKPYQTKAYLSVTTALPFTILLFVLLAANGHCCIGRVNYCKRLTREHARA